MGKKKRGSVIDAKGKGKSIEEQRKLLAQMYADKKNEEAKEEPKDTRAYLFAKGVVRYYFDDIELVPEEETDYENPLYDGPSMEELEAMEKAAREKAELEESDEDDDSGPGSSILKKKKRVKKRYAKPKKESLKEMSSRMKKAIEELKEKPIGISDALKSKPSQTIETFEDAGDFTGVQIWHIIKRTPVLVDTAEQGDFQIGDCYIVLKTFEAQDEGERLRKIHMWMGATANMNKRAICAFLGFELRQKIGRASMYQEEQGEETTTFLDYFGNRIRYVPGESSNETLNKTIIPPKEVRLIRVSYEDRYVAKRVIIPTKEKFTTSFSKSDDVFILATNDKIYVWFGKKSIEPKRIKGIDMATAIKHEEYKNREVSIELLNQGSEPEVFWSFFENDYPEELEKYEEIEDDCLLFHVSCNEKGELSVNDVTKKPLTRSMLDDHHTYILETKHELYIWCGIYSNMLERKYAQCITRRIRSSGDKNVFIYQVYSPYEPMLFKDRFKFGYYMVETPETYEKRIKSLAKICSKKLNLSTESYFDTLPMPAEKMNYYDEKDYEEGPYGDVRVFRVIDGKSATEIPEGEHGDFYTGECYLILYEFNRGIIQEIEEEEEEEDEEDIKPDPKPRDDYDDDEEDEEDYDSDDPEYKSRLLSEMGVEEVVDPMDVLADDPYAEETLKKDEEKKKNEDAEKKQKEETIKKEKNVKYKRIAYIDRRVLFSWEGSESDKKFAVRMLRKNFMGLVNSQLNPAFLVPQYMGNEHEFFMKLFPHRMIIRRGKSSDKRDPRSLQLYRIYCKSMANSRAIEVPRRKSSLNSNDVFVLVGKLNAWVWCGRYTSDAKKRIALSFAKILCQGKDVTALDEYMEPEEFWEDLSMETEMHLEDKLKYSLGTVFETCMTSEGKFRVAEIGEIGKNYNYFDLLCSHQIMIFDFEYVLYVHYPKEPTELEKKLAINAAEEILRGEEEEEQVEKQEKQQTQPKKQQKQVHHDDDDEDDEDEEESDDDDDESDEEDNSKKKKKKIIETTRGKEALGFKHAFIDWGQITKFVDKFAIEKEEMAKKRSKRVKECLPFLDIIRKKFNHLLTEDEYINVENTIQLIDIAQNCKSYDHLIYALEQQQEQTQFEYSDEFAVALFKFALKLKELQETNDE